MPTQGALCRRLFSIVLWGAKAALCATLSPAAMAALSYDSAISLALKNAPQTRMAQAKLDAARQAAKPAGELPDPKLALGLDDFPISGPLRNSLTADPMTMRRISLSQEMPNREKRNARIESAQANIVRSEAEQRYTQYLLKQETAKAWIKRYTIEQQLAQLELLVQENRNFALTIQAQLASGRAAATDAVLPKHEAAMLAERQDELNAQRKQAIAALRRLIGDDAEEPLEGTPRQWRLKIDTLLNVQHRRPDLLALDATGKALDAQVREAQAEKKPDWGVSLSYQRRSPEFGDMVSVQFNFDLPIFAEKRQDPKIAAKLAQRAGVDAELEIMRREHTQMLYNDLADLERVNLAIKRNRSQFQPLAQEKIDLSLAAYQSSKGSLTEVMLARREALELKLKMVLLQGEQAMLTSQLHFTDVEHNGDDE